jgi:hypothetical protein
MELLKAIMNSEGMNKAEALEILKDMRKQVEEGEDPEEVLYEFGLEPDYILDLL